MYKLKALKPKASNGYDVEVVSGKEKSVKGDMNILVDGFRRYILISYADVRHDVGQALVAVSKRLKEMSIAWRRCCRSVFMMFFAVK